MSESLSYSSNTTLTKHRSYAYWIISRQMLPLSKSLTCRCIDSGVDSVLRHLRGPPVRRLSQPQCHGQRRSKTLSPKIQAKRNSIASPFLDCRCGTGNRTQQNALCGAFMLCSDESIKMKVSLAVARQLGVFLPAAP